MTLNVRLIPRVPALMGAYRALGLPWPLCARLVWVVLTLQLPEDKT